MVGRGAARPPGLPLERGSSWRSAPEGVELGDVEVAVVLEGDTGAEAGTGAGGRPEVPELMFLPHLFGLLTVLKRKQLALPVILPPQCV